MLGRVHGEVLGTDVGEPHRQQCAMAIQTLQGVFFPGTKVSETCKGWGHICRGEKIGKEVNCTAGEEGKRGRWTGFDVLLKIRCNIKSKQQKLQQKGRNRQAKVKHTYKQFCFILELLGHFHFICGQ